MPATMPLSHTFDTFSVFDKRFFSPAAIFDAMLFACRFFFTRSFDVMPRLFAALFDALPIAYFCLSPIALPLPFALIFFVFFSRYLY